MNIQYTCDAIVLTTNDLLSRHYPSHFFHFFTMCEDSLDRIRHKIDGWELIRMTKVC